MDQARFSASWTAKSVIAIPEKPVRRHTSQPATAIERYRKVHTGPNSQFGGVKKGFWSVSYQPPLAVWGVVKREPRPASARQTITKRARIRAERAVFCRVMLSCTGL